MVLSSRMHYMIHTPYHPRPYYTKTRFLAHDFEQWGYRVQCHPQNSAYIQEVRRREQDHDPLRRQRVALLEIWAREVLIRSVDRPLEDLSREGKISELLKDFICGIATFGTIHIPLPSDPFALPPGPFGLISKYMRLLLSLRHTSNAPPPEWAPPSIQRVDRLVIEFIPHKDIRRDMIITALTRAVSARPGRMGRVERPLNEVKFIRVLLFTEVILASDGGDNLESEAREFLPRYDGGENPPPYEEVLGAPPY